MLLRLLETVDQERDQAQAPSSRGKKHGGGGKKKPGGHLSPIYLIGFDGFGNGKELHYYKEKAPQVRVNAAGALLHDWGKEQIAIRRLIDEGRVVLL